MSKFKPGTIEKNSLSTIGPPAGIEPTPLPCRSNALLPPYTARNAQAAASHLQACCLAVIKPISGCVRIACSSLII